MRLCAEPLEDAFIQDEVSPAQSLEDVTYIDFVMLRIIVTYYVKSGSYSSAVIGDHNCDLTSLLQPAGACRRDGDASRLL